MKNIFGLFKQKITLPIEEDGKKIIGHLRSGEKTLFSILFTILAIGALGLLLSVNDKFKISVPAEGGNISEGIIGTPRFVNPVLSISDADKDLSSLIYSGLVKSEKEYGETVLDLASKYTVSEDKLSYTFSLKDKAFFHDGIPVSAEDIEFTIQKIKDPAIQSPKRANFEGVDVEVIDSKNIKFTLKKPFPAFISNLSIGILPKHLWKNVSSDQFAFNTLNIAPIGAGAYKIDGIERDNNNIPISYSLSSFKKYAGNVAYIPSISIHFYQTENELIEAYKNGDITSLGGISPENIINIDKKQSTILESPLPRTFAIFYGTSQSEPLKSLAVRNALDISIDRKKIVDEALNGYAIKINGINLEESPDSYFNPEKARSILEKDGWVPDESGSGFLIKKTKNETLPLQVSISTSNQPELKNIAEMIAKNWNNIGVKTEVKIFESGDLTQNVIRPRKFDALLFGEVIGWEFDYFPFWHSSQRNYPGLNIAMYANKDADKLMEEIRLSDKEDTRIEKVKKLNDILSKEIPASFLYVPKYMYIIPKEIKGADLRIISRPGERFNNITSWYISEDRVWKKITSNSN